MQYFKNTDLTKMYPISEKAVRNWITAAKEGKLELALYEEGDKAYIANTSKNAVIIDRLVSDRKKFVNTKGRKTIQPTPDFYKIYNKDQIFDIITHLEAYGELPLKYSYLSGGAEYWDRYSQKLAYEDVPNILNRTIHLLDINTEYLLHLFKDYSRINIVDVGPGNGQPVREFLQRLRQEKRLNRYIAIDISQRMLDTVEGNMHEWFGDDFPFEGYVRDVGHDRFRDVLGEDAVGVEGDSTCNVVLLLGGTLANFRSPNDALRLIYNSLGPNDLLACSLMLDSDVAKRYFDFNIETRVDNTNDQVPLRSLLTVSHLNIDKSMYDVEQFFDEEKKCRIGQIRLKVAVTIEFNVDGLLRKIHFDKGDVIMLWQYKHKTGADVLNLLNECGFNLLQTSQSSDHEYILTISEVKSK